MRNDILHPIGLCIVGFIAISVLLSACVLLDGSLVSSNGITPTYMATIEQAADTDDLTINPDGGTFDFSHGISLEIPPGTVSEPTTVRIVKLDESVINPMIQSQEINGLSLMSAFTITPTDINLNKPVKVILPTQRTSNRGLPIHIEIDLENGTYELAPTDLIYDPDLGLVELTLEHFSSHGVVMAQDQSEETECSDPDKACRCKKIRVQSSSLDFSSGECQVVSETVMVEFLDCPGSPIEESNITESTSGISTVQVIVPDTPCFAVGETLQLEVITLDEDGNPAPGMEMVWKNDYKNILTVDTDGVVTGVGEGTAWIKAIDKADDSGCPYNALVAIEVISLNGLWSANEITYSMTCDEGINTYGGIATVFQEGNFVVISGSTGGGSGTKSGCSISGYAVESEDRGVSFGGGSLTISQDGRTMTGGGPWQWRGINPETGEEETCSGSSTIVFTR